MLIGIGIWGIRKSLKLEIHAHEHTHDHSHDHIHARRTHLHLHSHGPKRHTHKKHTHTAVGVGVLHGLAGGSHFIGVLPALAMPTRAAAAIYLFFFGLGTVASMAGFSTAINLIGQKFENKGLNALKGFMATLSSSAIIIGCLWFFKII